VPHRKVAFDILWTLFPPYKMVYFHRDRDEQCYLLEYCVPMITPEGGLQGLFNVVQGVHDSTEFGLDVGAGIGIGMRDPYARLFPPVVMQPGRFIACKEAHPTYGRPEYPVYWVSHVTWPRKDSCHLQFNRRRGLLQP